METESVRDYQEIARCCAPKCEVQSVDMVSRAVETRQASGMCHSAQMYSDVEAYAVCDILELVLDYIVDPHCLERAGSVEIPNQV